MIATEMKLFEKPDLSPRFMSDDYVQLEYTRSCDIDLDTTSPRDEYVFPLKLYESQLGMASTSGVLRQLCLDVPRSLVYVDGKRVTMGEEILHRCFLPRFCTQTVFAPVVEWFVKKDIILHEMYGPVLVEVNNQGRTVCVEKWLGMMTWNGTSFGSCRIQIHACRMNHWVSVDLERHVHTPRPLAT